jgi:hypothetical protein
MMRVTFLLLAAILPATLSSAVAVAQDASPDKLIELLGHDEYNVREDATKKLIALGAAAIPALEKAVQDEDVEVRMRAGRALRSIREKQKKAKPAAPKVEQPKKQRPKLGPVQPTITNANRGFEMTFANGEYVIKVTEMVDGKKVTKTFKGKSLEELKRKHPEVKNALGGARFRFGSVQPGANQFKDLEKFFEDGWGKRGSDPLRDLRDERWKKMDGDLNAEIQRLRQWARWLAVQRAQRGQRADPKRQARRDAEAGLLGIRARKPETVLDAQLALRGKGLVVEGVQRGTVADRLGLKRYDILLELNGIAVRSAADIRPALLSRNPSQAVQAKVMRRAQEVELKTEPVPAPKPR